MNCNYYFNGRFIGDELQLADYLLSKHKYFSQFKDMVFLLKERSLSINTKLQGEIAEKGVKAKLKIRNYVSKHGIDYDEMGRVINLEKPAMGVNKFLQLYTHTEGPMKGHRIVPEFIKEEFWKRKIETWSQQTFSDEDKELIMEIEGESYNFNLPPTEQSMNKWKDKIQLKWDAQGKIGSSLHAVAELFFSKTNDKYNFKLLEKNDNLRLIWYDTKFKNATDEYGKIKYGNYVNFEQFNQMIDMCIKLKNLLETQYGPNLTFYPEFTILCDLSSPFMYKNDKGKEDEYKEIIGIIDLLVVDSKGRTHIFDYKTSPKDYNKYSTAKERGFTYQLAVYDRILLHYGIYTGDGSTSIIPIKLDGFRYDNPSDKYIFDGVSYEISKNGSNIINVKNLNIKDLHKINSDIDEFIPSDSTLEIYSDNLIENTQKQIQEWCPTYQQKRNMNDELIRKMIEDGGGFKKNKNGELVFKFDYNFQDPIIVDADVTDLETVMFNKVKKEIESWPKKKQYMVEAFKDSFEEAVRTGNPFEYKNANLGVGLQDSNYLSTVMTPYCDGTYKIIDVPAVLCLGMLILQSIEDDTITVLKLTGSKLDFQHEFIPGNTNMNGAFSPDIEEDSKGNSLMLKAINANIEAIEAMLALQNMNYNLNFLIREIKVINPKQQRGQPISNKELMYTFNNLLSKKNVIGELKNKYKGDDATILLLNDAERLRWDFKKILGRKEFGNNSDKFNEFIKPELERLNLLDWKTIQREKLYLELNDLRIQLEKCFPAQTKTVSRKLYDLMQPETLLYNSIMQTMLELKNIDIRLQIKDSNNWLEHLNVFKYGWEGLLLENNGNFKSPVLNQLVKSVNNVYLKVKDKVNKENVIVRKLVNELKKLKNFGWVKSNISGNLTDMYKNMTYVDSDGDFLFVNPNTLAGAEKEFLEHALDIINRNRYPSDIANLETWKKTNDLRYYRVPLMAASDASVMSTNDMLESCKLKLSKFHPKEALKEMQEKAMGFFDESLASLQDKLEKIYEMNNIFDYGESESRLRMLHSDKGVNAFEHNVETILLSHCYAYELRNQMSKEMPIIKASALALSMQGAGANLESGNVNNLLDFIENYVKGVIKNQSTVSKRLRPMQATLGKAKKLASFLALAFSPIQFSKQSIEGLWKNCSLIIRKPDGTNAFTVKNMLDAAKSAYKDLWHYSDTPTKCQLINEIYGLNDMDSNLFVQRINSDQGIWTHFTDFAFRFASRPDFYNRLTIFGAQMRNDGTWDAHEVINGELVYKFEKDKRFSALKTAPKGSQEYNEALSRYLSSLELFKNEGVTNPDGSELKFGDDLPRAYTNQESQGMKAIADNMYGYYNHENKSMINSMLLGSLATQMKTYWSAKKNLYLAPGGVKLMGKWEDYKEDGQQLYYATDDRGEIDLSKGFVKETDPNCSGIKVKKWKGQWQEGIILTYVKFGLKMAKDGFRSAWEEIWNNEDENLRIAYRSNIKHLLLDLFYIGILSNAFAAVLVPWEEDAEKEFNKDVGDMLKACAAASAQLITDSIKYSFMDFNFIDSIFSPVIDWQPFAFSSLSKLAKNSFEYLVTDKPFTSTLANSMPAIRQAKPILKCISYNEN